MTHLWRYRITDMHRIRVTERLGVRLPASTHSCECSRAEKWALKSTEDEREKWRHNRQKPSFAAKSAIDCECPEPCRCMTTGTSKTLSMNCNCGDLRSFCTVASPPRRHLKNLHDPHDKDIDHHIDEKLGNLCGFQNSQDHEDRLCVTTGMSTTTRDIDTMASNWNSEQTEPRGSASAPQEGYRRPCR